MLNVPKIPNIFDLIYPVNAIYLTVGSEDPNVLFGGKWEKLAGGYALTTTNNTNGGDASIANAINHIPGQAFQGGLPNISGTLGDPSGDPAPAYCNSNTYAPSSGAFTTQYRTRAGIGGSGSGYVLRVNVGFDASLSSDRYGMYQSTRASVVADHIAVVAWKRTAVGGS